MIDIDELRMLVQDFKLAGSPMFIQTTQMNELLDRLEAAEAEALEQARLNGMGSEREAALMAKLVSAERKCDVEQRRARDLQMQCCDLIAEVDALRAKIEAMEKQELVAAQHRFRHPQKTMPNWSIWQPCAISNRPAWAIDSQGYEVEYRQLYALPGAQQCKNCNGMGDRFDPSGEKIPCDLCESNLEEIRALVAEAAHDIISGSDFWLSTSLAAKKIYAIPGAQNVPKEAIAKILAEVMDIAVSNGANSRSMPDEYVEVAAWLCGIHAQPAQRQQSGAKGE